MRRLTGEIISVNMLGRQMIILNSLEDAKELLQKRGYNYSDRPRFTLLELWVQVYCFIDQLLFLILPFQDGMGRFNCLFTLQRTL